MTIAAPGVLSAQVLRLLTRENVWSAIQSFSPGTLVLVDDSAPPASPTQALYSVGGNLFWNGNLVTTAAGVGTVTSVGLVAPGIFVVSGSPVSSSGDLTLSLATQVANRIWAGPATGADATPTFRALVDADVPDDITIAGTNNVTWASVNKSGSSLADLATRSASDLTSGLLALARLTDGATLGNVLQSLGGAGGPQFAALDLSLAASVTGILRAAVFPALTGDVTTVAGALATTLANTGVAAATYGSATAIPVLTIDAKGRITAASTASLTASFAASLIAGAARGSVIVGNSTPVFAVLTPSIAGQVLRYNGTDTVWSLDGSAFTGLNASALATGVTAITVGGTGLSSLPTDGQILIGRTSDNSYVKTTLTGTANQVTVTNGGGSIVLSTPQNIDTSATPQFARLGAGTGADATAAIYAFGPFKHRVLANGSSGAAITLNLNQADVHTLTLTANCVLTLSNPVAGVEYTLYLTQDGTGSRTVTWPTIRWQGGAAPTLTTGASKTDIVILRYDGTSYFGVSSLNY